VIAGSLLICTW